MRFYIYPSASSDLNIQVSFVLRTRSGSWEQYMTHKLVLKCLNFSWEMFALVLTSFAFFPWVPAVQNYNICNYICIYVNIAMTLTYINMCITLLLKYSISCLFFVYVPFSHRTWIYPHPRPPRMPVTTGFIIRLLDFVSESRTNLYLPLLLVGGYIQHHPTYVKNRVACRRKPKKPKQNTVTAILASPLTTWRQLCDKRCLVGTGNETMIDVLKKEAKQPVQRCFKWCFAT